MEISTTLCRAAADHQLYNVNFFCAPITTTVTSNPDVIANWIENAMNDLDLIDRYVVGMGVQWRPYIGTTPAATLQLAVGEKCLIIQLLHCDHVPGILREFLYGPYIFVGIWNRFDARRLEQCDHTLKFGDPPLDLRHHVFTLDKDGQKERYKHESFETIVAECLGLYGVRLERAISMSNWEAPTLDLNQVQQATVDAYVSWSMGDTYYRFILESIGYIRRIIF